MKKLVKKFLIFNIVTICVIFITCFSALAQVNTGDMLFDINDNSSTKYKMQMQFKKAELSGICIMKKEGKEIKGTIINEFGVKAFDFIYYTKKEKLKLYNVIKFLDKWYIRCTICSDLKMAFSYPKKIPTKKEIIKSEDGDITIINSKRKLIYIFQPM